VVGVDGNVVGLVVCITTREQISRMAHSQSVTSVETEISNCIAGLFGTPRPIYKPKHHD
jgi:hypothetical protein